LKEEKEHLKRSQEKETRIKFTKHASEKIEVLKKYGFKISKNHVITSIRNPLRLERRDGQFLAMKVIDDKYALRVVYEERKGIILIITFYPVRRERYGI